MQAAGLRRGPLRITEAVSKKTQGARFRNRDIKLTQSPGGGIARIGKGLLPQGFLPGVEGVKILFKHHHFAAYFKPRGKRPFAPEMQRHGADGAHGLGDDFTHFAIAARQSFLQHAIRIDDFQREAVKLGITPEGLRQGAVDFRIPCAAHTLHKIAPLFHRKDVVQTVHLTAVAFFGEAVQQLAAHAQGVGEWAERSSGQRSSSAASS